MQSATIPLPGAGYECSMRLRCVLLLRRAAADLDRAITLRLGFDLGVVIALGARISPRFGLSSSADYVLGVGSGLGASFGMKFCTG